MNFDDPRMERRFLAFGAAGLKLEKRDTLLVGDNPQSTDEAAPNQGPENPGILVGYASLFNEPVVMDYWTEYVVKGCWDESLITKDCVSCWNHNLDLLLGRCSSGTVQVACDDKGLNYSCNLPEHYIGQYVKEMFKRGDVSGMSIMFTVDDEEWNTDKEPYTRFIKKATLYSADPVWEPACSAARASLRSSQFVAETRRKIAGAGITQAQRELRLRLLSL